MFANIFFHSLRIVFSTFFDSYLKHKVFNFDEVQFIYFFVTCIFAVISCKPLLIPRLRRFLPYIFLIRVFSFSFYILVSDPFMYGELQVQLHAFLVDTQLSQQHRYKDPFPIELSHILLKSQWIGKCDYFGTQYYSN